MSLDDNERKANPGSVACNWSPEIALGEINATLPNKQSQTKPSEDA